MTVDAKIKKLNEELGEELVYSVDLSAKKSVKPNLEHLKKLTQSFRQSLEDYTVESTIYTVTSKTTK